MMPSSGDVDVIDEAVAQAVKESLDHGLPLFFFRRIASSLADLRQSASSRHVHEPVPLPEPADRRTFAGRRQARRRVGGARG